MIGIVKGYEIGKNKDGDLNVVLLQVQISDPDDIQTVQLYSQIGEDYIPPVESEVIIAQINASWKIAIATYDTLESEVSEGERKLYSISGNEISAFVYLVENGDIELNGNDDFAVRFNELDTEFSKLKDDLNAHIQNWNIFAAAYVPGGPTSQGTPPTALTSTESVADISGAKIDNIKVPS